MISGCKKHLKYLSEDYEFGTNNKDAGGHISCIIMTHYVRYMKLISHSPLNSGQIKFIVVLYSLET